MTSLMKGCMNAAAVLGIVAVAAGCGKKDEYGSGTASPGSETYASPGTGTYASPGTGTPGITGSTASSPVAVQVVEVDPQANTITVTDAMGAGAAGGTGGATGTESTTGSPMNRRTLTVDAAARPELSRVKPGDQVTITCAEPMGGTGTTGTGTTGTGTMGSATTGTGMAGLANCVTVASITPDAAAGGRGR